MAIVHPSPVALRRETPSFYGTARFLILVRILLLAVGLGILSFGLDPRFANETSYARTWLAWLLVASATLSTIIAIAVRWLDRAWKLVVPLIIDLVWIGLFCYASGGVDSPAVPLLIAVCLTTLLVAPGTLPFVMPSLAGLVLAGTAVAYLAGLAPFPRSYLEANLQLVDPVHIISSLSVQVAGLFTVDILGQVLTRRLREQRVLTDEVLDQLGEGVVVISKEGMVTYANNEVSRLLGIDPLSPGLSVERVFADPSFTLVEELLRREDLPVLTRYIGPEGRSLVLRVTSLTNRRGRRSGRVLLVADETRLIVLEESARRAERLAELGEMAAGIAHEIRNPLTSLRGCAQEVAEITRETDYRDAADLATVMVGEADRLARIVEDVLTLSRLRTTERQACDPKEVVLVLEQLLRYEGSGIPVTCEVEEGCPAFTADPDQCRQVLLNLVMNARDAVREVAEPKITLRISEDREGVLDRPGVCLAISDNGTGIPEGLIERVFTPFYTTKARGTGLGLLMVQRIVREHEGVIRVKSKIGQGSTFTVILPEHSQTRTFKRALGGA